MVSGGLLRSAARYSTRQPTWSVHTCLMTGTTVLPNTVDCRSAAIRSSTDSFSASAPLDKPSKGKPKRIARLGRQLRMGAGPAAEHTGT